MNNISMLLLEKAEEEIFVNRYNRIKGEINEIVLPILRDEETDNGVK